MEYIQQNPKTKYSYSFLSKLFKREKIYRLKDIQRYLKSNPKTWEIMSIQPLGVNYLIEDKNSIREICEIYNHFKKSKVPLYIHTSINSTSEDCYIKFKEEDALKLFK